MQCKVIFKLSRKYIQNIGFCITLSSKCSREMNSFCAVASSEEELTAQSTRKTYTEAILSGHMLFVLFHVRKPRFFQLIHWSWKSSVEIKELFPTVHVSSQSLHFFPFFPNLQSFLLITSIPSSYRFYSLSVPLRVPVQCCLFYRTSRLSECVQSILILSLSGVPFV